MRLTIENLSKEYKEKKAVCGFSGELTDGVYALLGPNGAGKTTLMRMLADILKPSSGRILYVYLYYFDEEAVGVV